MSLATVRASVQTFLATVSGIGQVHDYVRLVQNEAEIKALLLKSGVMHCWFLTLSESDPVISVRERASTPFRLYAFDFHGYMAVEDATASEKVFATVCEAVIETFAADKRLANTVVDCSPVQWRQHQHRMLVEVLCHYAQLSTRVKVPTAAEAA